MIRIDPGFQSLVPPLSADELAQLETNILADGCRDPLVTWHGAIIDGHNRYAICSRHGIEFETVEMDFESREAAEDWMDANQLGRRNLSKDQYTLLLGRRYNRTKKKVTNPDGIGGKANKIDDGKSCHQQSQTTAQKLAKEYGVSEKTVRNAGEYAEAVEKLKDEPIATKTRKDIVKAAALIDTAPEQSRAILSGEKSAADVTREVKRAEVIAKLEDVAAVEQKRLEGKYDVIVIDPPWPMEKIERWRLCDLKAFRLHFNRCLSAGTSPWRHKLNVDRSSGFMAIEADSVPGFVFAQG
jgi:hypothetical protein